MWLAVAAQALCDDRTRRSPFQRSLSRQDKRRRDRRIARLALHSPSMSSFEVLFGSGDDRSLITLTGFDHHTFRRMLELFEPLYGMYSPYPHPNRATRLRHDNHVGRPRSLNPTQALALTLAWYRTRGSAFVLCMLFGISESVCAQFVKFGRAILLRALSRDGDAMVRLPSEAEARDFCAAFAAHYPMLHDVFAVADGLKIQIQASGDFLTQNRYYNGWTHGHYVGSVLVFAPNGTIVACAINAPGSMHDSSIAEWGGVYEKLQLMYDRYGVRCVVDSAFSKSEYPFLIKSSQDAYPFAKCAADIIRAQQATSARQASEWGMRGLQGSFPRIHDPLRFEEKDERKTILYLLVLLYNFRSRRVGINQILSTFMPQLKVNPTSLL